MYGKYTQLSLGFMSVGLDCILFLELCSVYFVTCTNKETIAVQWYIGYYQFSNTVTNPNMADAPITDNDDMSLFLKTLDS